MKKPPQIEAASKWTDKSPVSGRFRKWSADGVDVTQRQLDSANQYSRFVGIMKIALPLAAFAILLAVIVASVTSQDAGDVSIFFTSTTGVPGELHMIKPKFTGFDSENRPYLLTAETAVQDKEDDTLVHLETVAGELSAKVDGDSDITFDEPRLTLSATGGLLDSEDQLLTLTGSVTVASKGDYLLRTQEAVFDFENDVISGDRPVSVEGAVAKITADRFELFNNAQTIVFRGSVKTFIKGKEEREAQENKTEPDNKLIATSGSNQVIVPIKKIIAVPSHEIIAELIRERTIEPTDYDIVPPIKKPIMKTGREPAGPIVAEPARDIVAQWTNETIVKPIRKPQSRTTMRVTTPKRKPNP
ncbi:MAG: hypothetical protein E2O89_00300 [Alphaproteobacteria bacterium]|nr:MAG: hypothetical protein E2O89_00300 [Alphaproteobacteria bacterium]